MTRTALAPKFTGAGTIEFADHEYPDPGPGQLLLAVQANALCGTDRHQYYDGSSVVPGHEAAGTVLQTGDGTTTPVGTRGAVFLMDFCGECRSCKYDATNQCLAKRADMGFTQDGGYGPYELVHESNFFPITDDIEIGNATMLLDVMGTSSHALGRAALVRQDVESVYIAGAGPIGLGLTVMSKLKYDVPVYISDFSRWRLEFAESFGAIPLLADDLTAAGHPDLAFDASGKESARRAALDILSPRGALICVGHGESVTLDVSGDLISPERAVLGSEYFRYDEMPGNLALLQDHQELIGRVISHRFPVADIAEAFRLFMAGETGKVVVTQDGAS
ncbi:(R,R)-butanediol dehydrogenase/meso-butanediol dehydrogenase/diacetyl reductase [Kribbella pratensis]|uniref:(R,R)-butanediol dehydrogenase/meso-butanediol dehydrogenase/diacetyl reductase n=1 Tax=Kribbella pratensis TaxID=2512112 RepID=A0ABY2F8F4_9ACTN|nr:alcohol dehydrogenase catalytic domain-containing protein [Kribbella pratensis]TDW84432.1 (R,R)-butanediol dehydrogenase/meso-butanediol dehydrogenase/diacetyl reductase [Kribbella pratensis]